MKFFNKNDKLRITIGIFAGLLIYFGLSIIVKLCGLDLFSVTNDIPALIRFNDIVMSNVLLEDLVRSLMFTVDTLFVYGICGRIYEFKELFKLNFITFIIAFGYNLLAYYYDFPILILTALIPFIIILLYSLKHTQHTLFINKNFNTKIKSALTSTILYVCLSVFIIILQQGIFYLKFNILKFSYFETNIFNLILFSCDIWYIYFSIYIYCKIRNKGEDNNGR